MELKKFILGVFTVVLFTGVLSGSDIANSEINPKTNERNEIQE